MAIYFNHVTPEPPPLNEKLLDCVLKHIEEHPEKHRQSIWIELGIGQTQEETECGTKACVAGWACLLSLPPEVSYKEFCDETPIGCSDNPIGKTKEHVRFQAQQLLGLTDDETGILFAAGGPSIRTRIETIKRNRGLLPPTGDPK